MGPCRERSVSGSTPVFKRTSPVPFLAAGLDRGHLLTASWRRPSHPRGQARTGHRWLGPAPRGQDRLGPAGGVGAARVVDAPVAQELAGAQGAATLTQVGGG